MADREALAVCILADRLHQTPDAIRQMDDEDIETMLAYYSLTPEETKVATRGV